MVAFERAMELGVDALETDVHLTRDGAFIVSHDPDGARRTGSRLRWNEIDLADAQRLDAGWGYVAPDGSRPFAGKGISVPRFEQLLELDVHINVDIKGDASAVDPMLELVRRHKAEHRVTIACFSSGPILAVRRKGYGGETALSQAEVATLLAMPAVLWRQLPFTGTAAQVPTHQGPLRFDRATFIAKCHSLGLRVDFWTVDEPTDAARLLELGADGIMTNDPAAMRVLFS
jgi:glycerophosphoryl diester phosphodiesterase